jgi:phosphoribosyl-AMP cyclohydrolase
MQEIINKLKFNEAGLIPAVAQDTKTKEVLIHYTFLFDSINVLIYKFH